MVKNKQATSSRARVKVGKVKPKMARIVSRKTARPSVGGLDAAASDYMRLIKDPCNAKLCNTIWPGTSGSLVSRFESDFILWNDTSTSGVLAFVPGANALYYNGTVMTLDTTASTIGSDPAKAPGNSFLTATASGVRAVACCLEISFPGTELNRSGIVALGQAPFSTFVPNVLTAGGGGNVTLTASNVRTLAQHTERMPQDRAEILFQPGPGDQNWYEFNTAQSASASIDDIADKNCLFMSVSGLPATTGVRIRIVNVVEWMPKAAQGLVASVQPPPSKNTLNDVLRALPQSGGTNWFINAYKKAAPYVRTIGSIISYGAKVIGPALAAF